jgi:hypothetical protein
MEFAYLFIALRQFSKLFYSLLLIPLFPHQVLRLQTRAEIAENRNQLEPFYIGPYSLREESFDRLRQGGGIRISFT